MTIDLDAIKARLTNADPGPWAIGKKYAAVIVPSMEQDCECSICPPGKSCNDEYGGKLVGESIERHNAEFIANAPSDIAALIEEVERLQSHIKRWAAQDACVESAKYRYGYSGQIVCNACWSDWPCPSEVAKEWNNA